MGFVLPQRSGVSLLLDSWALDAQAATKRQGAGIVAPNPSYTTRPTESQVRSLGTLDVGADAGSGRLVRGSRPLLRLLLGLQPS